MQKHEYDIAKWIFLFMEEQRYVVFAGPDRNGPDCVGMDKNKSNCWKKHSCSNWQVNKYFKDAKALKNQLTRVLIGFSYKTTNLGHKTWSNHNDTP